VADVARRHGLTRIEPREEAMDDWVEKVNAAAAATLLPQAHHSWYLGANVPGKPRMMMALLGFPPYVQRCEEVVRGGIV
jgi:hypothetical protein